MTIAEATRLGRMGMGAPNALLFDARAIDRDVLAAAHLE
jgi:hypothetical protein